MKVELPKAFQELLTAKARYKLFYGGRAGGKSFAFADALLTLATSRPLLIACVYQRFRLQADCRPHCLLPP